MRLGVFLCFFFFSAEGSFVEEDADEKEDNEMGPVFAGVCTGLFVLDWDKDACGCCCIDDRGDDGTADVMAMDGEVEDELLGMADRVSVLGLSFICSNIFCLSNACCCSASIRFFLIMYLLSPVLMALISTLCLLMVWFESADMGEEIDPDAPPRASLFSFFMPAFFEEAPPANTASMLADLDKREPSGEVGMEPGDPYSSPFKPAEVGVAGAVPLVVVATSISKLGAVNFEMTSGSAT